MLAVTLDSIRAARERIGEVIYHSPCPYSLNLSRLCGSEVYCKLDHLQMTGSFKERGARNKLLLLPPAQRKRGVIAASAGNHALALAYHGKDLGVAVTVVMPRWSPLIKVKNCRAFDANVILHGDTYDAAKKHAQEMSAEQRLTYVPGFDDPDIIAGAGTLGLEILEDVPDVDVLIVPVGGGGLIAGVGRAVKAIKRGVRIIGVEPINAPTMHASLQAGHVVHVDTRPTLADGLAVAEVGKLCFDIAKDVIDDLLLVDEPAIARAVLRLLELEKTMIEGAGAVPLAAAMDESFDLAGKKVVLLLCGGNIDVSMISKVIDRGLAADGRLCRFVAHVSDRPGSLAQLTAVLGATGASVKEVEHDRHFGPADVALVNIVCVLETRDFEHIEQIKQALRDAKIPFRME